MKFKTVAIALSVALVATLTAFAVREVTADGGGENSRVARPVEVVLSPEQVLTGDRQALQGRVAPPGRPVQLERKDGSVWEAAEEATTAERGAFAFEVTAAEQATIYRVVAPAAEVAGETRPARTSPEIEVRGSAATGSVVLRPAIGLSEDGSEDLVPGIATFRPAKQGAEVTVEMQKGGSWRTVAEGEQDERGEFAFQLPVADVKDSAVRATTTDPAYEEAVVTAAGTSPWKPSWADEFDGSELGPVWTHFPSLAANRRCATVTGDMVSVEDGLLNLRVEENPDGPRSKEECPDGQFFNVQMGTEKKTFTYGVFSARIKFQQDRGMHSAFWLYPWGDAPADPPNDSLVATKGAEMDVLEYYGDGYTASDAYRAWAYEPVMKAGEEVLEKHGGRGKESWNLDDGLSDLSGDWHVVSLEWTPEGYIYRFDGEEYLRINDGVSHREQKILFSLLTSTYEIPRMRKEDLPGEMQVDWVRVWQR